MWRHPSDRQPGTHERPARRRCRPRHLRQPPPSPRTTPLDHTAHRKLPWICGRSDHCQIALKHGLSEADILHAYHHPIQAWDMGDGFTMLLGANRAALVLEIGYIQGITAIVIVHAMRAREKFLR